MKGPEIFIKRLNIELNKLELKSFKIFIPLKGSLEDLDSFSGLKIGRLDGAIYFKHNAQSFFNLIKQRKNFEFIFIKWIPNFIFWIFQNLINNYLNRYNRDILEKADIIIFQSSISKKMHEFFWGKVNKANVIIYNGVDRLDFKKRTIDSEINLVITARFRLNKRLRDVILLVNKLNHSKYKYRLHVIGALDNLTKKSIKDLDKKNIKFYGEMDYDKIQKIYNSMHIGISPSMFDPCPNSVVEMMSFSLPVISTSASGASELIGINQLIVEEDIDFKLYDLHDESKIPKINIDNWVIKIEETILDYENFSAQTYERFINNFDIKIIAENYKRVIESYGKN